MKKKVLVCASTMSHILNFHMPYIKALLSEPEKYDVKIMATCNEGTRADFDVNFKKRILSLNNLKLAKQISKILEEEKFDIIFTNTTLAAFYVRLAVKKLKVKPKVVNIVHGYLFDSRSSLIKRFLFSGAEKFVKKQTDVIITMNQEDYDYAKQHKLCTGDVFLINGMGVDDNRVKLKNVLSNNTDDYTFTFIGELSSRKNQRFLIKFIHELDKMQINAKLNLIGDGAKEEKLKKQARKLKIQDKINFVGYQRNICDYLSKNNFYISASEIEGLPFNIIEAMQAGQVVISADTKGSVDVIDDFENGVLYKLNDMKDFVFKFRLVKNDLELQNKIRKNALETVKKYQISAVFEENIELFKKLIED